MQASKTPGGIWKWLTYSMLCAVADALDTILSTLANSKQIAHASDVDELSDKEILELGAQATKLFTVWKLTPNTVLKIAQDMDEDVNDASESNALDLVFAKTTIPVPRVRRVIKADGLQYIIMDFVRGQTLAEVWPTFSLWTKIWVAFTLRGYVRQLRRLEASTTMPPGPLSAYGPRTCELPPIFGQYRSFHGPFASSAEFSTFFNKRCQKAFDANCVPKDDPSRKELFDDSSPLVLSHLDLNPRNVILGEDGRLWIIDWAWAGYYPPWFEYVAMLRQVENEKRVGFYDRFWECMIPFVCGPYFRQEKWLTRMARGFSF